MGSHIESFESIKEAGEREYFKEFYRVLNMLLKKHYNTYEVEKIMQAMEKGIINIGNIQIFLREGNEHFQDPTQNITKFQESLCLSAYLLRVLLNCKIEAGRSSDIYISHFLLHIARGYAKYINTPEGNKVLSSFFRNFLTQFSEYSSKSKVTIRIYENLNTEEGQEFLGINKIIRREYHKVIRVLFKEYKRLFDNPLLWSFSLPTIEIVYYLSDQTRRHQLNYLKDTFASNPKTKSAFIAETVKNIPDLGEDSVELRNALRILKSKATCIDIQEFFEESIIKELKYIKDNCNVRSFGNTFNPEKCMFLKILKEKIGFYEKYKIRARFIPITEVYKLALRAPTEIKIECENFETFEDIKLFIDLAAELAMIRYWETTGKEGTMTNIVLNNIPWNKLNIVEDVRKEEALLLSKHNVKFNIIPCVREKSVILKYGHAHPEYFRIISDIHTDINKDMNYSYNFGDDYVLSCGDISSNHRLSRAWLNAHVLHGSFIIGNHLGYSSSYPEKNGMEGLEKRYGMQFHPSNTQSLQSSYLGLIAKRQVTYLNNTNSEIDGIKIFGAPLFTDFKLFGEDKAETCEMLCSNKINDFKYIKIFKSEGNAIDISKKAKQRTKYKSQIVNFNAEICKQYFNKTITKFKEFCNKTTEGEPVVLMTHFGVSMYSIADKYKSDPISAYFASDLTEVFKEVLDKGANLRLICHGHVHEKVRYILKYGEKEVLVVAEPFGYYYEREDNQQDQTNYGLRIPIKYVKGEEPWSKLYPEIKVYEI